MSGYKAQVINDDCCSLWSFDGDLFDPVTRRLLVPEGEPRIIMDEIDNLNPAILHSDHEVYLGYRLGLPSMVVHEQTDQHSCAFGYYGRMPDHPSQYPKAYLEIPHTTTYMFPRLGSFSIEFIIKKDYDNYGCGIIRPVMKKAGVFDIRFNFPCYGTILLEVFHPGGSTSINTSFLGQNLLGRTFHFCLVWSVVEIGANVYRGTARSYINARVATEQVYTYYDTFPNTNIVTPIEIGGVGGSANLSNDRNTSPLILDQIAVYDKAITQDQVANHYSKIFPYVEMLKNDFATNIWEFSDVDSLSNFTITPLVGNLSGEYIGVRSQNFIRQQPGPSTIPVSTSASFMGGGHAFFSNVNAWNAPIPINISGDYSYEWWFRTSEPSRCVLLSAQQYRYPFNGLLVQLNMRDHNFFSGALQFSECESDPVLNSRVLNDNGNRFNFNDGKWHHIAIVRAAQRVQLWLDGIKHSEVVTPPKNVGAPGQITLMNMMPGRLKCDGFVCDFAIYPFALQEHQIKARVTYSTVYKIRGIVTLMGVPFQATLRFYKTYTGELVQEIQSDPESR